MDDSSSNVLFIRRLKFLKFLEASKLGSNRASGLLNLGFFPALLLDLLKCFRKASIYRSLGVGK